MCLADRSDDGGTAWPSIPGICEWTCLSRTAVIVAMKGLEDLGLITIEKESGKNNRCRIDLHQCAARTGTGDAPVRETHPSRAADAPPPVRQADYTSAADAPEASVSINQASRTSEKRTRKARATSLPEGFAISDSVKAWAAEKGFSSLDAHLEHFVGYAKAGGKQYVDWDAALMNAIRGNWAKVPGQGLNKQEALEDRNRASADRWAADMGEQSDPDRRSVVEAEAIAKGLGPWDQIEQ